MAWTDPTTRSDSEFMEAADWNTDVTNNLLYLLSVVEPSSLTNNIGASAEVGTVVVQDTGANNTFTTSASLGATVIGVAGELIADGGTGRIITQGIANILVTGNVSAGDFVTNSTTAGRARSSGRSGGSTSFGVALTSYSGGSTGSIAAFIYCSKTKQAQVAPSGLTMFVADDLAPSEHSEYTTARGRVIVGLPSGGTNEGTVASALTTDLETLAAHTHGYTAMPTHDHVVYYASGSGATSAWVSVADANTTNTGSQTTEASQGATATTNDNSADGTTPYIQLIAIERD